MGSKSTTAKVERKSGDLTLHHQEVDSPILPIAHIERLQEFRPDIVDFIVEETGKEAKNRRDELTKHNSRVFIERISAMLVAGGLCAGALYGSFLLAMAGHDGAAIALGTTAAIGIAGAFLANRRR